MRALLDILHWFALILWTSALVSAAVAAMNVFPITDRMPLTLEQYGAMAGDEHPRIAAGIIMEGVFHTVDVLQFVAAPVALITLVAQLVVSRRRWRPANLVRTICLVLAAGLLTYHATTLAPPMNKDLHGFWSAAEAGDVETAQRHRDAFATRHPIAENILSGNLLLVLIAAAATAARRSEPGAPSRALQRPMLAG